MDFSYFSFKALPSYREAASFPLVIAFDLSQVFRQLRWIYFKVPLHFQELIIGLSSLVSLVQQNLQLNFSPSKSSIVSESWSEIILTSSKPTWGDFALISLKYSLAVRNSLTRNFILPSLKISWLFIKYPLFFKFLMTSHSLSLCSFVLMGLIIKPSCFFLSFKGWFSLEYCFQSPTLISKT